MIEKPEFSITTLIIRLVAGWLIAGALVRFVAMGVSSLDTFQQHSMRESIAALEMGIYLFIPVLIIVYSVIDLILKQREYESKLKRLDDELAEDDQFSQQKS